jgi:hypothetical protein
MTNTRRLISIALCQVVLGLTACAGGDDGAIEPPACLTHLDPDCSPSVPATFDAVYGSIVQSSCGLVGGSPSCHSAAAKQAGLDLSTPARAYDALLGKRGRARVLPGDPDCSVLMQRIEASDDTFRMPLGTERLAPGLRCAIQQWIAAGAER